MKIDRRKFVGEKKMKMCSSSRSLSLLGFDRTLRNSVENQCEENISDKDPMKTFSLVVVVVILVVVPVIVVVVVIVVIVVVVVVVVKRFGF